MSRTIAAFGLVACVLMVLLGERPCRADDPPMAVSVKRAAERMRNGQFVDGLFVGAWPGEEAYTGSIIAGLTGAFELVCDVDYRAAALAAGEYVMIAAAGNYYGDEAYAMSCLSRVHGTDGQDPWRVALGEFYQNVETLAAGGTQGYVSQFGQAELSQAVFYLSHHVVAASYVGASTADVWRQGMIDRLVHVDDDSADLPVLALGVATWALATTGELDESLLDPCDVGVSYWRGRTLADLPGLLLSHQMTEGELAGSFYWRFDHGSGGAGGPESGYVEEAAFGTLGLAAANASFKAAPIRDRVLLARDLLAGSADEDGVVRQHMNLGGGDQYYYAAAVLRALAAATSVANLDLDGVVEGRDLALWAARWRDANCPDVCACGRADLDRDGQVDTSDLAVLAGSWLDP